MKSIAYLVPYFGTLPGKAFRLWLQSCRANPTVDWVLITDDKTEYDYPENFHVYYCTFAEIVKRINDNYDFEIFLDRGWKLCDYRPAYGELFAKELEGYDFWGHCDIDLMFGDIRKFYTDELLEKYDKIGHFGHSTLYRNTPEVNARYKYEAEGLVSYKDAFTSEKGLCFDETGIENIYKSLGIPYYSKTIFANLTKYETKFHLGSLPPQWEYKNESQVFTWKGGTLLRHYLEDGKIVDEEYLYIHFWCRPMTFKTEDFSDKASYLIYSDELVDFDGALSVPLVKKLGKGNVIKFYSKTLYKNRKKLTPERIIFNIKGSINSKLSKK